MVDGGAFMEGQYRYLLWRYWGEAKRLVWVLLNPSTADARQDDPTIRRCVGFAKGWGYDGIQVVNLFAYRATDPRELKAVVDPVGPRNDEFIERAARGHEMVVVAWGANGGLHGRGATMLRHLQGW